MNKLNEIINSAPSASSLLTGAAIVGGGLVLDMKDAKAADIALTLDASASLIANTEDSPSYVYYVAGDLEGADHARTVEISGNDTAQVRNAADTDYVSVESALTSYDSDKFDDPLVAIHDIEGSEVLFSDYNAGVYCLADLSEMRAQNITTLDCFDDYLGEGYFTAESGDIHDGYYYFPYRESSSDPTGAWRAWWDTSSTMDVEMHCESASYNFVAVSMTDDGLLASENTAAEVIFIESDGTESPLGEYLLVSSTFEDTDGNIYGYGTYGGTAKKFTLDVDMDEDGVGRAEDCDDTDPSKGAPDTYNYDTDGDTYGDMYGTSIDSCTPLGSGYVVGNTEDCNDTDANINPDTYWYPDADEDGQGDAGATPIQQCEKPAEGYVTNNDDECDVPEGCHTAVDTEGNTLTIDGDYTETTNESGEAVFVIENGEISWTGGEWNFRLPTEGLEEATVIGRGGAILAIQGAAPPSETQTDSCDAPGSGAVFNIEEGTVHAVGQYDLNMTLGTGTHELCDMEKQKTEDPDDTGIDNSDDTGDKEPANNNPDNPNPDPGNEGCGGCSSTTVPTKGLPALAAGFLMFLGMRRRPGESNSNVVELFKDAATSVKRGFADFFKKAA